MIATAKKIFETVFPMIANYIVNQKVRKNMNSINEESDVVEPDGNLSYVENSDKLSIEIIKEQYNETFKAKDKLEDKAKTNIIGITISITLIMGASGILTALNEKYPFPTLSWVLFALIVVTVAYMLTAGILVIRLLTNENEVYVVALSSLAADESILRNDYDECIKLNQSKNIIRNNYIFTSYECIRNSLICLFIILILVTIPINSLRENTGETITYTTQTHNVKYSSSAVDYIKKSDVRIIVENAIKNSIENAKANVFDQPYGIIEDEYNLFIKFYLEESCINVLLIESYLSN